FGRKISGKQYASENLHPELEYSLNGVSSGIYFLRVMQGSNISVLKIIRQ
ncbi:MAG: T9SS type A sorting domain-containing protein, partial [Sphingobacteriales bacterium]